MRASALLSVALLGGCAASTEIPGVPTRALAFRAQDLDGHTVTFGGLRGRITLVTFLYTWADPALFEVPRFIQLTKKHRDDPFTIVAIVLDDTSETARIFRDSFEIPYLLWRVEDRAWFTGAEGPFGVVDNVPTSFLVDRDGRIVARMLGTWPPAILEQAITELLASDRSSD